MAYKYKIDHKLVGDIAIIVFLVGFFSVIAILLRRPDFNRLVFDIDTTRSVLQGGRDGTGYLLSATAFVFAGGCLIALGLPRIWVSTIAGIIYGAFAGIVFSLLASILGSSFLYAAGSLVLSDVVERRTGATLKIWRSRFQENAFWWVLYGRLFPFSNSTIMSLLCGSCRVPFPSYVLGSTIGFFPLAVVFATYGSGSGSGNTGQIVLATVILLISIFFRRMMNGWFISRSPEREG